jgi:ABC-type multidrug transport system fused ATPase/permease subunit
MLVYIVIFILFVRSHHYSRCFLEWGDAYHNKHNAKLPPKNIYGWDSVSSGHYISLIKIYVIFSGIYEYLFLGYVLFFVKWWFAILLLLPILLYTLLLNKLNPKAYNYYSNGGYRNPRYWEEAKTGFIIYPIIVFLKIYLTLVVLQ